MKYFITRTLFIVLVLAQNLAQAQKAGSAFECPAIDWRNDSAMQALIQRAKSAEQVNALKMEIDSLFSAKGYRQENTEHKLELKFIQSPGLYEVSGFWWLPLTKKYLYDVTLIEKNSQSDESSHQNNQAKVHFRAVEFVHFLTLSENNFSSAIWSAINSVPNCSDLSTARIDKNITY